MNTILSKLDTTPEAFASLYYGGLALHDKSFFKNIYALAKSMDAEIDIKLKAGELKKKEEKLTGRISYNYDVQAALCLLHEKLVQHNLLLTMLNDKRTPDCMLHIFIQKEHEYASGNSKDYILCTMQEADKSLLEEIFISGLAYNLIDTQRKIFSGYYDLDYDEVDDRLQHNQINTKEFTLELTNKVVPCICTGTWFQLIEQNDNGVYLRTISTEGKRSFATFWLNDMDLKFLTTYLPKAIAIAQQKGTTVLTIQLSINTEQKGTDYERLLLSQEQLQELSNTLKEQEQWLQIEKEIYTAFKDVKLEDGIGYWEANVIDNYYKPDDAEYKEEKARDERSDWTKMLAYFEHKDTNYAAPTFMDTKGLYFYLPFLMVRQDCYVINMMSDVLMDLKHPPENDSTGHLCLLLTSEQKRCILHFFRFMTVYDNARWTEEDFQNSITRQISHRKLNASYNFMELMAALFDV